MFTADERATNRTREPLRLNTAESPLIFVVDPDERMVHDVALALDGARAIHFQRGGDFLRAYDRDLVGCVVINIALPDMTGIELQARLLEQFCTLPMVFVGRGSSVAQAVQVMRKGAVDFLDRPFERPDLAKALTSAVEFLGRRQKDHVEVSELSTRFDQLTIREREVLDAIVSGKSNRAIGEELGISQKTVETHRLRLMNKLHVKCLADLVRVTLRWQELTKEKSSTIETLTIQATPTG